jgi:hypothetical protein
VPFIECKESKAGQGKRLKGSGDNRKKRIKIKKAACWRTDCFLLGFVFILN